MPHTAEATIAPTNVIYPLGSELLTGSELAYKYLCSDIGSVIEPA